MPETRQAIPSAYNTITSNRCVGYEMGTALADIVDNSISAHATKVDIFAFPNPLSIAICDNGTGMDQEGLDNAMTFGGKGNTFQRSPEDLGRFGLGLKTASLSQCRQLTVITKKDGVVLGGRWDMDYLENHNEWNYLIVPEEECRQEVSRSPLSNYASGTLVIWKKFDTLEDSATNVQASFAKQTELARKHLELVFHRYLSGEENLSKISMAWNKRLLEPNDPFLTGKVGEVSPPIPLHYNNSTIIVIPHKLPYPSQAKKETKSRELADLALGKTLLETQGFYIYRNKRLISWGSWFRLAPKLDRTKLLRIQVDIPNSLDSYWHLDIKKSTAFPPDAIRQQLKNILDHHEEFSVRTFKRRISQQTKSQVPYWNRVTSPDGAVEYTINKMHPLVQELSSALPDNKKWIVSSLLDDLSTFFPVASLQADLQGDASIKNEDTVDSYQEEAIWKKIDIYLSLGYDLDKIKEISPISDYLEYFETYMLQKGQTNG